MPTQKPTKVEKPSPDAPTASSPNKPKPVITQSKSFSRRQLSLIAGAFILFGIFVILVTRAGTTTLATVEAEGMAIPAGGSIVSDAGASDTKALLFAENGSATGQFTLPSATSNLAVRARGSQCEGAPQMIVKIDGVQIQSSAVSASGWTDYPLTTIVSTGTHSLNIDFTNDFSKFAGNSGNLKCSRDLYVDKITFFGTTTTIPVVAPTVSISTPVSGATVSGSIPVQAMASASTPNTVAKVEFWLDGSLKSTEFTAPYCMAGDGNTATCFNWDSKTVPNGSHTITAYAYDSAGAKSSASNVTINVNNLTSSTPPPSPPPLPSSDAPFGDAATLKSWVLQPAGSDEFNDSTLNLAKWSPTWVSGDYGNGGYSNAVNGYEIQCFHTGQTTISNGTLKLKTATNTDSRCKKQNGSFAAYKSGIVTTYNKYSTTYGYFEARINAASINGNMVNWPAFWTVGSGLRWPDEGEIDILEELGKGTPCWHYHYRDSNGVHQGPGGCIPDATPWSGWHIYAAHWQPGKITFYYDGKVVGTQTSGVTSVPHFIILLHAMDGTPYVDQTMEIDYVRVWK